MKKFLVSTISVLFLVVLGAVAVKANGPFQTFLPMISKNDAPPTEQVYALYCGLSEPQQGTIRITCNGDINPDNNNNGYVNFYMNDDGSFYLNGALPYSYYVGNSNINWTQLDENTIDIEYSYPSNQPIHNFSGDFYTSQPGSFKGNGCLEEGTCTPRSPLP